jgi:hypothetical protein
VSQEESLSKRSRRSAQDEVLHSAHNDLYMLPNAN